MTANLVTLAMPDWTKSAEYREKNFAREALTVNPAKACQPLGAVFVTAGFERAMTTLIVRAAVDTGALVASVRSAVAEVDPEQPPGAVRPMEALIAESVARGG